MHGVCIYICAANPLILSNEHIDMVTAQGKLMADRNKREILAPFNRCRTFWKSPNGYWIQRIALARAATQVSAAGHHLDPLLTRHEFTPLNHVCDILDHKIQHCSGERLRMAHASAEKDKIYLRTALRDGRWWRPAHICRVYVIDSTLHQKTAGSQVGEISVIFRYLYSTGAMFFSR